VEDIAFGVGEAEEVFELFPPLFDFFTPLVAGEG